MAVPGALPQQSPHLSSSASLTDILSAIKNLVLAIATLTQDYMSVQGLVSATNITTPTVVKSSAGRIARVSVLSPGTTTGAIYDAATVAASTKTLWVIPMTQGVGEVNLPASFGIYVVPGQGQAVTVSYS